MVIVIKGVLIVIRGVVVFRTFIAIVILGPLCLYISVYLFFIWIVVEIVKLRIHHTNEGEAEEKE